MKIIKALLIGFFLYVGTLLLPNFALALDNDHSSFGACDISVNETTLTPGATPEIYTSVTTGGASVFNLKVCGNTLTRVTGDQEASPNSCSDGGDGGGQAGQELRASINTAGFSWKEIPLTMSDGGCYTGTIEVPAGEAWNTNGVDIDIELDDDSDRLCRSGMPACRRVKAIFNREVTAQNSNQCQQMTSSFQNCEFLNLTSTGDQIYSGQPLTISGTVDPLAKSAACGTENSRRLRLIVNGPESGLVNQTFEFGQDITTTFTPTALGDYKLKFMVDNSTVYGGTGLLHDRSNLVCEKNFRVCPAGDATCSSFSASSATGDYAICASNLNPGSQALTECSSCYNSGGIWTAIGCISQDPRSLISKIINVALGISGGITLVVILISAFSLTISGGDVKKTSDAKEWLTAAIMGLIFIILSVSILEFIGTTVLRIPGFGG